VRKKTAMDQQTKIALFKELSWPEIQDWAGATIAARGRSYQRGGHVAGLARTAAGEIVAWVHGTRRYATLIDIDQEGLVAACSCPYADICKHAVAVVLAYQEQLQRRRELPTVADSDPRLLLLEAGAGEDWDDEDWQTEEPEAAAASGASPANPLRSFLEQQTKAQLIDLFEELAGRFPELHSALDDRRTLATGTAEQLVRDIRRLIVTTSAEPAWRNHWNDEGSIPDYGPIRDRLTLLLQQGYADDVVSLGETLLKAGIEQVEQSHDEGETQAEIAGCMNIVFRALARSSLQPSAQLLWAIDAILRDQYDLCADADVVLEQPHTAADWSIVADELLGRLRDRPAASRRDDFMAAYARERLTGWIITALEHAGRGDEVIPLAEREAELNGDYLRLVKLLIAAGRTAAAEQWIARGIEALGQTQRGTVRMLRDILLELRRQAGDYSVVAAMRAEDFFQQPSMATLLALQAAAEQAGVWPAVQAAVMRYLETGEPPEATARSGSTIPAWPLPATGSLQPEQRWPAQFPMLGLLIEIAARERQPERVLYWYDRRPSGPGIWSNINAELVANTVAAAYPERAIAIWKQLAEAQIAQTQPRAYEAAVGYLQNVADLMRQQGRDDEWRRYLAELRQTHKRKRRLLEMLDSLERRGPLRSERR